MRSREGETYLGCPTCGNVTTTLLDPDETPPWCLHSPNRTVSWRAPNPATQEGANPWTQMVPVQVVTPEPGVVLVRVSREVLNGLLAKESAPVVLVSAEEQGDGTFHLLVRTAT